MDSIETIFLILVAIVAMSVPVAVLILSIVALVRTGRIKHLESRIQELERRQHELVTALEDQATYADAGRAVALNRELAAVVEDLEKANSEWEIAATRVQELIDPT